MAKEKILVVCQHFWPEEFRINDICSSLVEMGHKVDVICGIPNYPFGKYFEGYSLLKKRKENFYGVNVHRSFVIPRGSGNPIHVLLNYVSFPFFSLYHVWKLRKDYDKVLVYQLTPVFMAIPAIFAKKILNKTIFIYIQDLWPESLYSVFNFKSKLYKKVFNKISDYIYKQFDFYFTTSKGIKEKIEKTYGIDNSNVLYLPNWAEKIYEEKRENRVLKQKYQNTFNIIFAGNIGPAQSFETIINAAKICLDQGYTHIKWIIVGDGMTRKWAEDKVAELGIQEVIIFLGRKPLTSMPEYYDVADALLVSLVKSDLFGITIPSKIQSYLASGKPIIASLDGEGANIIRESESGYVCESENASLLADNAIQMSALSSERLKLMGNNARDYYLENFEKNKLLAHLTNFLHKEPRRIQKIPINRNEKGSIEENF
ncbi:glycosyltransferase family 4 protein [Paenibacillus sp. Soil787]|uniref:glycosyltransferase family 4 protein n=1 Tax=Paenibacillus sp. Soil787 TaxID=1736411 RepID=UPI0006F3F4DC|nr:glycosyltransferase family 4 protein [Paenibacillus sp. Soil787]KRF39103.1 hypothetical protein ASG93_23325 [Paenibacillus sp. Soil787]